MDDNWRHPYIYSPGQDGAPAMSADGNELYFYSSRAGGTGLLDLYVSTRQLPVVRARGLTVEAGDSCVATVKPADLDDGSFDPGGGSLSFSLDPAAAGPFGLGTHTVRLIATDEHGVTDSAITSITVVDQTPPLIGGAAVDKDTLWPANHEMVDVTVSYSANDNCALDSVGLSVSSNEPNDSSDWEIIDAHHVRLRAERDGNGPGRVYSITITAVDTHGNFSTQVVAVSVPHDRGRQELSPTGGAL